MNYIEPYFCIHDSKNRKIYRYKKERIEYLFGKKNLTLKKTEISCTTQHARYIVRS